MDVTKTGEVGEHMLMTELMRRGFHAAHFSSPAPADVLSMWNNRIIKRIQVKSCASEYMSNGKKRRDFTVMFQPTRKRGTAYENGVIDFFCFVPVFMNPVPFYIVPYEVINEKTSVYVYPMDRGCVYSEYINNFGQLKKP